MASKGLKKGIFITFEGPEGSGKTTHAKLLYDHLTGRGYPCVLTREPGGTKLGEAIRDVLLHSKDIAISGMAELFLFEACRSQIVKDVIRPALSAKKIVICDRYGDATVSYQGYGGGISLTDIGALNRVATGNLKPDLTILLDVDILTGLKRAEKDGVDRMEGKPVAYHKRVRNGYLTLAKRYPARIKVIRVTDTIENTQRLVRREVGRVVQRHKRAG